MPDPGPGFDGSAARRVGRKLAHHPAGGGAGDLFGA